MVKMNDEFNRIQGRKKKKIAGQERFKYSKSDYEDLHDLIPIIEKGDYPGCELIFYDLRTLLMYRPFDKVWDVGYSDPVFIDDAFYILEVDYGLRLVSLYKYYPEKEIELIDVLDRDEVNLYNLKVVEYPLHIISQDRENYFHCYYPEKFSFQLGEGENVVSIVDGKVYVEKWLEGDCPSQNCRYYHKIIVKDYEGNVLSEEIGSINDGLDDEWWIS